METLALVVQELGPRLKRLIKDLDFVIIALSMLTVYNELWNNALGVV